MATHLGTILSNLGWVKVPDPARTTSSQFLLGDLAGLPPEINKLPEAPASPMGPPWAPWGSHGPHGAPMEPPRAHGVAHGRYEAPMGTRKSVVTSRYKMETLFREKDPVSFAIDKNEI